MKDSFCSSPWFHVRISYDGNFNICRWSREDNTNYNIKDCTIMDFYNSAEMKQIRLDLLNGGYPKTCASCYYEDKFGKVGGRKKQLLKSAITIDDFALKMRSSPHYEMFKHSYINGGHGNYMPVDLQLDLGNTCNSACIMCYPRASSRLEQDYKILTGIDPQLFPPHIPFKSWTRDPQLLERVVNEIGELTHIKYIHFLGGETLYDPAFYKICDKLIERGLAKNIIIGTTTNGTVYTEKLERYFKEFKQFHLGISIETVTPLNDYIRYPSKIEVVLENIKKFLTLRDSNDLFVSLRITPTVFTVHELDLVFKFMIDNHIVAESCNILTDPPALRMELMPENIRNDMIQKLESMIEEYGLAKTENENVRNKHRIGETIANNIIEYYTFLKDYTVPHNVEELRYDMVKYIKAFEQVHKNRITDYAPQYAEFLASYGY